MHTFDDLAGRKFYLALPDHGPKGAGAQFAMVLAVNFFPEAAEASGRRAAWCGALLFYDRLLPMAHGPSTPLSPSAHRRHPLVRALLPPTAHVGLAT